MRQSVLALCILPGLAGAAHAQDAALDDRLRDLLHSTTTQLRAAQDNAASLQASLDTMTHQRDQLQQQLAAAQAKPAAPVATPVPPAALQQAQASLAAARAQNAALAAGASRLQSQYAQAAAQAQAGAEQGQRSQAGLHAATSQLATCQAANTRLIGVAQDILHLYETPQFNRLLITSKEPLIGMKRVQLENLVQDYDDRIAAQSYGTTVP